MSELDKIAQDMTGAFSGPSIKDKILNGIKTATEKLGIKLVNEEWASKGDDGSKWDCACALGCMLAANNQPLSDEDTDANELAAANFLGVDKDWVEGFITGFDNGYFSGVQNHEAYRIGTELRQQFNLDKKDEEEEYDDSDEEEHF